MMEVRNPNFKPHLERGLGLLDALDTNTVERVLARNTLNRHNGKVADATRQIV